jgi:hypothetical protein
MPNIWTHILFGRLLADRTGLPAAADPMRLKAFQIGCQGPDFLFYHRFLPWQTGIGMPELGGAMHKTRCGPFLLDLIDTVRGQPADSPAALYALGFLTHHVLDRHAHPYVFYLSGFRKWNHQRFEIILDTVITRKLLGIETWKTPVWTEIDAGPRLPGGMAATLDALARAHYPEHASRYTPDDWDAAYRDMIAAQKLFHDPSGWKRALTFGKISPLVYKRRVPPLDFLNESKREWRHPSVEDERHTESFWDLWERAVADGETLMRTALARISGGEDSADSGESGAAAASTRAALAEALGDYSYETGKPCAEGHEIRFADPMI